MTPMARSAEVTATAAAAGGKAQHLVQALVLKLPHTACANASADRAPLYLPVMVVKEDVSNRPEWCCWR